MEPQPENEGVTQKTDIIDGWNLNADLGYDDGLTAKLTGGFTHQQTVSEISKEINVNLKKDGAKYSWEYDIPDKYQYKSKLGDLMLISFQHRIRTLSASRVVQRASHGTGW